MVLRIVGVAIQEALAYVLYIFVEMIRPPESFYLNVVGAIQEQASVLMISEKEASLAVELAHAVRIFEIREGDSLGPGG